MVVQLAHGLSSDGARHRTAIVRPLTGADEARLADCAPAVPLATRVTTLLAGTTSRIGEVAPTVEDIRSLTLGDREQLSMALRHASFGPRLEAVASCATPGCGAQMDVELDTAELAATGPAEEPTAFTATVTTHAEEWRVRFRLPNGADLEHAATLAAIDVQAAADSILDRCVLDVTDASGQPAPAAALGVAARAQLEDHFRRLDPLAEMRLSLCCPECGQATPALFDAGAYLIAEIGRQPDLFDQVHRLARAYHWTESDILALPSPRRRRYLELLDRAEEPQ